MIPRLKPYLDGRELLALFQGGGGAVARFEQAFAQEFGARHAIAFSYGRSALYALFKALGFAGHEIVLPAYTCSVVAHAVMLSGNVPRFVDATLDDYNMDLDRLSAALNERTRAVIATHLFGCAMDVDRLREIVAAAERKYGNRIVVIQDCAHAFGARWNGSRVCNAPDVALFGLNISKMMTSIFGGMLTTDDDALATRVRDYRDANFCEAGRMKALARRLYLAAVYVAFMPWFYRVVRWLQRHSAILDRFTKAYHLDDQIRFPPDAFDRMLPVEARVGLVQLAKYGEIERRRVETARRHDALLRGRVAGMLPPLRDGATYSHYVIRVPDRDALIAAAAERGVELGELIEYSIPHLQSYREHAQGDCPVSLLCSKSMINLPVFADLSAGEATKIVGVLTKISGQSSGPAS
jgi:dTDP-4-amino-4,6-dideoxygalactose transaminase